MTPPGTRNDVAAAAYRAGTKLLDARTGLEHDYRRKGGVVESFIAAPDGCDWITDRNTLWDTAEAAENRKNSTAAREWLGHSLTLWTRSRGLN